MIAILANESFVMLLAINVIAAVGMNLVYITGQLNLGQAAFLAVGAYTLAVLDATWSWPLPLSLAAGALTAGIVAFPVALGANRVRGIYLIMGTLAVGEVVRVAISNIDALGGLQGYSGQTPVSLAAVVVTMVTMVVLATVLMVSPLGLKMRSVFDDEDASAAAGVATRRIKIASVVISATVVGVAGGLLAKFFLFIAPRNFGIGVSFLIALFTLIGGVHSLLGAIVGAFLLTYMLEFLRVIDDVSWVPSSLHVLSSWRFVIYGGVVMVVMAFLPEGLVSRRLALRLTAPARAAMHRLRPRADKERPRTPTVELEPAEALLEIVDVSHRFDGVQALDGVTFSVRPGEIVALVGANGAGKSTLIDVVAGRYACQRGSIRLHGEEMVGLRPEARVRAGIARTFQSVRMLDHLTVEEVIRLGRIPAAGRGAQAIADIVALVELEGKRDQLPASLTLASQRRLEIGRAFASSPTVLLLDEPSVGMNVEERGELADLVHQVRRRGAAIVLVDHNLDLALGVADRVVVLDFGSVLAIGDPKEITDDPRVREAYLGASDSIPGFPKAVS